MRLHAKMHNYVLKRKANFSFYYAQRLLSSIFTHYHYYMSTSGHSAVELPFSNGSHLCFSCKLGILVGLPRLVTFWWLEKAMLDLKEQSGILVRGGERTRRRVQVPIQPRPSLSLLLCQNVCVCYQAMI